MRCSVTASVNKKSFPKGWSHPTGCHVTSAPNMSQAPWQEKQQPENPAEESWAEHFPKLGPKANGRNMGVQLMEGPSNCTTASGACGQEI
jgi:hypothetical protein